MRLVGGNDSFEGRVEVYYQGDWGTICGDGWGINNADIICRQLGYPLASEAWQGAHFGPGSGPILLDEVSCSGSESHISECGHNGWFIHNCNHGEDAGVTCVDTSSQSLDGNAQDYSVISLLIFVLIMFHSQIKSLKMKTFSECETANPMGFTKTLLQSRVKNKSNKMWPWRLFLAEPL